MSPTRKPNPLDRGAPTAHKPSRKVALDEVLRSLQDLVQNELNVESPEPGKTPPAVPAPEAAEPAPAASPEVPVAETVILETLSDADEEIVMETPLPAAGPEPAADPAPLTRAAESPVIPAAIPIPPGGLQQELPYLDAPAPPVPETPAIIASEPATALSLQETDSLELLPEPVIDIAEPPSHDETSTDSTSAALGESIDFSDIPVLEDAVELSEDLPPLEALAPGPVPGPSALPPAPDARRLAIQVAARLNVTLRKEGKPVLASDVIARLAHELEEALAKAGSNMENNPPEKH
jgi:hypothetical protein